MPLDRDTLNKLVDLLTPLMGSEQERRALLIQALVDAPVLDRIDYSGSAEPFTVNMLNTLADYGEVEPGKPAIWALLETVRECVGSDKQRRIDALRNTLAPQSSRAAIPAPPELYIKHTYILTRKFFGRNEELARLDEWGASGDSTMIVEAIGGVGKSALTWEWLQSGRAAEHIPGFAGAVWWSFYEGDAQMSNFTRHVLAYVTGEPLEAFNATTLNERVEMLTRRLCDAPYLLVLDGLERIMVAYHRMDAAQMSDQQVEDAASPVGLGVRACTDPQDARLLQLLTQQCGPTKVLISTRLRPSDLENRAGQLMPGIRRHELNGMHPKDALAMMRHLGITGDEQALDAFMEQFGYHSLLLGVVAGLVNRDFRARGDFDVWYERKGQDMRLSDLDVKQRRTNILEHALSGLRPEQQKLLSQLAAFRYPVDFDAMDALNPYMPPKPEILRRSPSSRWSEERREAYRQAIRDYENSPEVHQADDSFEAALHEIEDRGLLHYNDRERRFDLHPIVRAYAFEQLEGDAKTEAFERIRDYFERVPPENLDEVTELGHLRRTLEIYWALAGAGHLDDAARLYGDRLGGLLQYNVAAYHAMVELLMPLFPNGTDQLPALGDPAQQGAIMHSLASAFYYLGQKVQALTLYGLMLKINLDRKNTDDLGVDLHNYAISLQANNRLSTVLRAYELVRDLAAMADDHDSLAKSHLSLLSVHVEAGQWAEAEAAYEAFSAAPPRSQMVFWQSAAEQYRAMMFIYRQHPDAPAALDKAEQLARQSRNALGLRVVQCLRGEWALLQGDPVAAMEHFRQAVTFARKTGGVRPANLLGWTGADIRGAGHTRRPRRSARAGGADQQSQHRRGLPSTGRGKQSQEPRPACLRMGLG